jgi:hypothetical protein
MFTIWRAFNSIFLGVFYDKDITWLYATLLETFDSKMKPFFIMIVFDTFDDLMLRHDVCLLSFSEIHTWIKKKYQTHMEGMEDQRNWLGIILCIPHVLHQATMKLLPKEREIESNTFWQGWIQTAVQR